MENHEKVGDARHKIGNGDPTACKGVKACVGGNRMQKVMKVGRENKVKAQNPKAAIKPHAGMLKHAQEAIKCKKRGSSRKQLKKTIAVNLKCWTLD